MNKLIFFFFICCYFFGAAEAALVRSKQFVKDELLVKYKSNTTSTFQKASIEKFGARRIKRLNARGLSHVKLPKNQTMEQAIAEFKQDPDVEYVQPNYLYKITATPNDTFYGQLWGLKNTAQTITNTALGGPDSPRSTNNPGTLNKDMKMESAWDTITNCSSVIVAVLDTGINYNHEDLAANMWDGTAGGYPNHGYDYVDSTNDPMDKNGHGTHVAGTIGAVGNNGKGTTGVCWQAKLMAVRVLDATGSGSSATIIQGINFAAANGAKVINMSLGGSSFDQAESDAITNAQASGVLFVVAAGNDGTNVDDPATPTYPCKFTQSNILCVAALDQSYALASFSNYGTTSVDVAAPGVNIVSTWPGTHTTQSDALTSGWNFTSGWSYKTLNFGSATACLVNPTTYDYSSATYANNANDTAWKSFNLTGATTAVLDFYLMIDSESSKDFFNLKASSAAGDPTAAGTTLDSASGSTGGSRYLLSYDITPYASATTTIGFNFTSDAANVDFGANVSAFSITTLSLNATTYNVISGTSMATPNVAGVAAMLFAYNPNFSYSDVINAIKSGGDTLSVLSTKTVSGKAVNATNALSFITAPTGGAAVKLP